jgi:hypothetical protein
MRFILYRNGSADQEHVLWQRESSKSIPLTDRTPAALLAGWNIGLQQIMEETNLELRNLAVLAAAPPNPEIRN